MTSEAGNATLVRLLSLSCLMAGSVSAGTWSGTLVDARCYESAKNNHNVYDSTVVRDVRLDVKLCAPKAKTRSFAIVQLDGEDIAFDSAGNAQAAQLIRHGAAESPILVVVNGEVNKKTIAVASIVQTN